MLNEFDTKGLRSNHFETHHKAMENLSIVDIAKAYDYVYLLSTLIDPNNEVLDDFYNIINPLAKVLKECETEKVCPFCNHKLYLSDLPQYDYVCAEYDENFYEGEVE